MKLEIEETVRREVEPETYIDNHTKSWPRQPPKFQVGDLVADAKGTPYIVEAVQVCAAKGGAYWIYMLHSKPGIWTSEPTLTFVARKVWPS